MVRMSHLRPTAPTATNDPTRFASRSHCASLRWSHHTPSTRRDGVHERGQSSRLGQRESRTLASQDHCRAIGDPHTSSSDPPYVPRGTSPPTCPVNACSVHEPRRSGYAVPNTRVVPSPAGHQGANPTRSRTGVARLLGVPRGTSASARGFDGQRLRVPRTGCVDLGTARIDPASPVMTIGSRLRCFTHLHVFHVEHRRGLRVLVRDHHGARAPAIGRRFAPPTQLGARSAISRTTPGVRCPNTRQIEHHPDWRGWCCAGSAHRASTSQRPACHQRSTGTYLAGFLAARDRRS